MDFQLENDAIRYVLRRRRMKELGKSMGDLEDYLISKSTISNIEKAKGKFASRTIEIYLEKLGLTEDEILKKAQEVRRNLVEYSDQLDAVGHIIDLGYQSIALKQLGRFEFEEYHPLMICVVFLYGRIFYEEKDYDRAKEKYLLAIELCKKKYNHNPSDNIIARCYKELARCSYKTNNLDQTLQYVDLGLDSYDETKEGKEIKYHLLGNKVMYLSKSSQNEQASRLLDQIWPEVEKLDSSHEDTSVFNLYKHRSILLRDSKMYAEAHQCCRKGMQIARNRSNNSMIGHYLDFLIISGSIYLKQKMFNKAFDRLVLAIDSDSDLHSPRRHMDAHTYLGILFSSKKDWKQAIYHLNKAIQLEQENPDPFRLSQTLIVMGDVYLLQDQLLEALNYYQKSITISEKYNFRQREYAALWKLVDCFDKLNESKQKRDCLEKMHHLQKDFFIPVQSEVVLYEV
ncbi:helix-turn-helix transcriptional regulator [Thermoactinomyces sp. DSM 45892]|uniref:helix-turn-helix transcriptional regulator n=1 Tax=Thermoactinomyces sp. DSM 45892 TaxID=1882753 RepID=UPI000894E4A4|nr:helix-turn-helix transcriptional regulator [Thermoactinomyces sp. DSM 45892]SDY23587.1 Helix-turn-helix [Thermoactinomyces sp. DSM 45892]